MKHTYLPLKYKTIFIRLIWISCEPKKCLV